MSGLDASRGGAERDAGERPSVPARFWSSVVAFVTAREGPESLALVRVAMGLSVVGHLFRFWQSGAPALVLTHARFGGMAGTDGWLSVVGGATPGNVELTVLTALVSAVLVTLGLFTRPALLICLVSLRVMVQLNPEAHGAYDMVIGNTLFLLLLSGSHRALSLDARLRRGRPTGEPVEVARWPRALLVLNLGLMYFGSGLHKLSSGWVPGGDASALWYILNQPMWARGAWLPLWSYPLTQVATTLVWLWEMTGWLLPIAWLLHEGTDAPGRPWARLRRVLGRVRWLPVYVGFGVAMHLGIEVFMEVGAFSFVSLALYPALRAPARWVALGCRLRARVSPPR